MDRKRYKWHETKAGEERFLVDSNECNRVVAIVSRGTDEIRPTTGGPDDDREPVYWWGVFSPFRKKSISQHLTEKDATKYAEANLAEGEREERIAWES